MFGAPVQGSRHTGQRWWTGPVSLNLFNASVDGVCTFCPSQRPAWLWCHVLLPHIKNKEKLYIKKINKPTISVKSFTITCLMTLPFTRSVETILKAYFDQNNVSTKRLHTFTSKAGEEVGEKRRVLLLDGIFSRPDVLLLEPFQVLVRAQRTRVGWDAPFTLASPFSPPEQLELGASRLLQPWKQSSIMTVQRRRGEGGRRVCVTWSRAALPAQSCWRTLASHPIKGIVQTPLLFSSQQPRTRPSSHQRLVRTAARVVYAEQSEQKSEAKSSSKLFVVFRRIAEKSERKTTKKHAPHTHFCQM